MSDKLTFIEPADTETQVFDWGRLNWLSEPGVTAAERFSAGVVRLEPGKGHERHNHPYSEEILYVISGKGLQMVEFADGETNGKGSYERTSERETRRLPSVRAESYG